MREEEFWLELHAGESDIDIVYTVDRILSNIEMTEEQAKLSLIVFDATVAVIMIAAP